MMFSRWPIRKKLILGIGLLLVTVVALSISSFVGVYAYRGLAKSISLRATELPLALHLVEDVAKLHVTYNNYKHALQRPDVFAQASNVESLWQVDFDMHLESVRDTFRRYRIQLEENRSSDDYARIGHQDVEMQVIARFQRQLDDVSKLKGQARWVTSDTDEFIQLDASLDQLSQLSTELPSHLHKRMQDFANEVRGQYRFWIGMTLATGALSSCLLVLSIRLFYAWVFRPLRILVYGSRRVAAGDFGHRIQLNSQDEMAELAQAMNNMTRRFQEIRDDLDQQVQQRTKEVVRSEQLASVGFLAAGVAHEINNPLASVALCAESLEDRLGDIIKRDDQKPDAIHNEEVTVLRTYLRMIQDEAFRCKEITDRLLDFSRLGDVEKQHTDLTELTQGVIDMVGHLGKYKEKQIHFQPSEPVIAPVNSQEMKQVVLNLVTNALDSLDPGGTVNISLVRHGQHAELVVQDDGCGMSMEVQEHLFEPFFTRRRDGQGTGLGMSITYRIVADHGGDIAVHSDGPGTGSRFTVTLPLTNHGEEENQLRYVA